MRLNSKISLFALAFSIPLAAEDAWVCRSGDSIREIYVMYEVDGQSVPCHVVYRKSEGEQTLWSAQNKVGYCEEKAAGFVDKQRGWGWECEAQKSAEPDETVIDEPEAVPMLQMDAENDEEESI